MASRCARTSAGFCTTRASADHGPHQAALSQTRLLHLVPDAGPHHVRRLCAPDRFRAGLPRLAGLLRQRDSIGRHVRHPSGRQQHAVRAGHSVQGLDRDDPPLRRRLPGHADHRHRLDGLALPARAGPLAGPGRRRADRGVRAGRVRRLDGDPQADAGGGDRAPGVRPAGAVADDLAVGARTAARAPVAADTALAAVDDGRVSAAAGADHPGRLGQHQLRGAGLHGLPDLPWPVAAGDGFPWRFFADSRVGRAALGK